MCGIVGFTGKEQAAPILLDGLSKLEYRGYDSAGIAVRDGDRDVDIIKAKGRLKILAEKTNDGKAVIGSCGIGHTRWATHGEPSENNAHPHRSDDGNVVAVHNGIIENYQELKEKLVRKGYAFYSDTDTEVAVKLVDYYYKKYEGTPVDAINHAMVRIRGSYALAVMFNEYPEEIYVARKDSPMILGIEDGESYIASDVPAILKYTRNVYYIGNMEMARVRKGEITFYNLDGDEIEKELKTIDWNAEAAEKAGYEHFMMKEIHEQPKVVGDTINSVVKEDFIDLTDIGLSEEDIKKISQIYIVACGSAYHVGIAAQYVIEDLAKIPVRVELGSEFRYRKPLLDKNGLVVVISQSGETADSLAALREAKEKGVRTLGIVNVVGSSIAREADSVFYTLAGPEIAVATTKAEVLEADPRNMVYDMMGWDTDCRYKILGHKITHEDETMYIFDLLETEIFMDTKRKKKVKTVSSEKETTVSTSTDQTPEQRQDEIAAKVARKLNRIPFYPKGWKDSFGLPVEEHKKALETNLTDGYIEFSSTR